MSTLHEPARFGLVLLNHQRGDIGMLQFFEQGGDRRPVAKDHDVIFDARNFVRQARLEAEKKAEEELSSSFAGGRMVLLRRDIPETVAASFGCGSESGIAYGISEISDQELCSSKLLDVFGNPHASTLERINV